MWLVSAIVVGTALLWICWSLRWEDVWSISIYAGDDPFSLKPHPAVQAHPVLTAADVTDVRSKFVADPFFVRREACWYMFFEALESASKRGVIAVASSEDGLSWRYQAVVLREPFHLSYPYVFQWQGAFYMVPESAEASAVRLYRAVKFPDQWQLVGELLAGKFWDPSLIHYQGLWWLFSVDEAASLRLHYAAQLHEAWIEHPQSPLLRHSVSESRPGGRLIVHQNKIVRYAQDGRPTYGSRLRAFQIDELTTQSYREHQVPASPVLVGSGRGWNATGMHHADVCELDDGVFRACVDGNHRRLAFNWRAGARRIVNLVV